MSQREKTRAVEVVADEERMKEQIVGLEWHVCDLLESFLEREA